MLKYPNPLGLHNRHQNPATHSVNTSITCSVIRITTSIRFHTIPELLSMELLANVYFTLSECHDYMCLYRSLIRYKYYPMPCIIIFNIIYYMAIGLYDYIRYFFNQIPRLSHFDHYNINDIRLYFPFLIQEIISTKL